MRWTRSRTGALICAAIAISASTVVGSSTSSTAATNGAPPARVLRVGTYHGMAGQYTTIQAAVDAARPGDWILVAPGIYHEADDHNDAKTRTASYESYSAGVAIETPNLHLRGMDRNHVVVDGTLPNHGRACNADARYQDFGVIDSNGNAAGRNGIVVGADHVSVENLTVCNYLKGSQGEGNEIWWNGGDETGTTGMHGYTGRYLTATSTYYGDRHVAASYGIFSSNAAGPALFDQIYGSNMSDSGLYVGACKKDCGVTIDHAWMQYSALGYSGTNSGGAIVVQNSEFDHNKDGFDTNTQIQGDPPAPQDGRCPGGRISPITHTRSCWVFQHNYVHDNNDPNVATAGSAGLGPVGTGMTISGGRFDTVQNNRFENNGAWGILFVPFPDGGTPDPGQTCESVGGIQVSGFGCVLDTQGSRLIHNTFRNNGSFGNPSNGDFGELVIQPGLPKNCYRDNVAPDGFTPSTLQTTNAFCNGNTTAPDLDASLFSEVLCDTQVGPCDPHSVYPRQTHVVMHPLPRLDTMPDPCDGVPYNAWCTGGKQS